MSDLDPDAKSIVDAAREADDPTTEDRARVHRAVMAAIASGATVIAAGSATASATTGASASVAPAAIGAAAAGTGAVAAGGMSIAAKIVAVVLIAGALGGGALLVARPWEADETAAGTEAEAEAVTEAETETETVTEAETVTAAETVTEAVTETVAPEEMEAQAAEVRRQVGTPRVGTRVVPQQGVGGALGATPLQIEARLIREATEAIGRGDTEAANRALDEHAQRFPSGLLREERERLRTRGATQ